MKKHNEKTEGWNEAKMAYTQFTFVPERGGKKNVGWRQNAHGNVGRTRG